jgi:GT2 family glycosyltransferase
MNSAQRLTRPQTDPIMRMGHMPRSASVAIIVLNYNGCADTLACLHSLRHVEWPDFHVFVVDNASEDGSPDRVADEFPEVTLVRNRSNLGFAAANNIGMQKALQDGHDYVLLLNNDTRVAPGFLAPLVEETDSHPYLAAVGPAILYDEQPDLVWCAGARVEAATGRSLSLFGRQDVSALPMESFGCDYVSGCAMLMPREAIEDVGFLDSRFFIYYEETDWCTRARAFGGTVRCVPRARMWHKVPVRGGRESPRVRYLMTRNCLLYLAKHSPRHTKGARLALSAVRALKCAVALAARRRFPEARAVLRGVLDFTRGRFGAPPVHGQR